MFFHEDTQNMVTGKSKGVNDESSIQSESVAAAVPVPAVAPVEQLSELQTVEPLNFVPTNVIFEQVATVVSNNDLCIAKDRNGKLLAISNDECLLFAANPYSASFIPMSALNPVYVEKDTPSNEQPNNNQASL